MSGTKLLSVTIERFKSFESRTEIPLAPLTVILGCNNSGKSSIIQCLLLLKQTLAEPRSDIPIHLDGVVSAFNLRELTFGWPANGADVSGPTLGLRWESTIDMKRAADEARRPDRANLAKWTGISRFEDHEFWQAEMKPATSSIQIDTVDASGTTLISAIRLQSDLADDKTLFTLSFKEGSWTCLWRGRVPLDVDVELDHFVPYLKADLSWSGWGPRDKKRTWYNAYLILLSQPLEALKKLLSEFQYLGSTRHTPPSLYKASNVAPQEIGASGELAAQLLHRRGGEVVHYLPPLIQGSSGVSIPEALRERPLVDAVNDVLEALSIQTPLSVEEIREIGFRLLFGSASLLHVGRGLAYLLPLVELGLYSDPLRFLSLEEGDLTPARYSERCKSFAHIAIEEAEAHLHPKVQSLLAHWLVSLAMSNRRLIVETHSDHLVRRLRGLVARSGAGSALETWLLENVVILEVEQDSEGRSTVKHSKLTAVGGIAEHWPAGFMDESSEEESAIFYGGMAKRPTAEEAGPNAAVIHDEGGEPEVER
ncbi:MAG: AAA family ATPase [Deltaproteobacteria bacterium]|nr:AAA family ATPase [Deltaproteobacteria bacterium]